MRRRSSKPALATFDKPTERQVISGSVLVEGWALDLDGYHGALEIWVDGQPAACRISRETRPDVHKAFPDAARSNPTPGFAAWMSTHSLKKGAHELSCVRRTPREEAVVCTVSIELDRGWRETLAQRFLRGSGLEVGALHEPLPVPEECRVHYVDRLDNDGLRAHYPELNHLPLVEVDVVDDGETLQTVQSSSQDFIIANHFLEHTQNPIGTLERYAQVLRRGGVLYMAVPDKRWTFDVKRPVTPLEHLYRDYREGPAWSYLDHVHEWVELVGDRTGPAAEETVRHIVATNHSIHFHVWTTTEILEMLLDVRRQLDLPLEIEAHLAHRERGENILVLRRT